MLTHKTVMQWNSAPRSRVGDGKSAWRIIPTAQQDLVFTFALMLGCEQDEDGWYVLPPELAQYPRLWGSSSTSKHTFLILPDHDGVMVDKEYTTKPQAPWSINADWLKAWEEDTNDK